MFVWVCVVAAMTPTRLTLVVGSVGAMKRGLVVAIKYAYVRGECLCRELDGVRTLLFPIVSLSPCWLVVSWWFVVCCVLCVGSHERRQFGPPGKPEWPIMKYTTHQTRYVRDLCHVAAGFSGVGKPLILSYRFFLCMSIWCL